MSMSEVEVMGAEEEKKKEDPITAMASKANTFLEVSKSMVIDTREKYETADDFCARALKQKQEAERLFKPMKQAQDAAKRVILDQEKAAIVPLEQGRGIIKNKMLEYEKKLKAEEAKRQAIIAEQHKKDQEILRKAEEDKRIAQAETLESQGKPDEAEHLLDAPLKVDAAPAPAPIQVNSVPQRKTVIPEAWDYEIINIDEVPREWFMLDDKKVRAQCKATKKDTKIPGIRAYDKNAV